MEIGVPRVTARQAQISPHNDMRVRLFIVNELVLARLLKKIAKILVEFNGGESVCIRLDARYLHTTITGGRWGGGG